MAENKHTISDLHQMQALPLSAKIRMTQNRIRAWYEYWNGDVYVSFSGGKDSTVLLDIARKMYPNIEAVFVDTGLEYPEIREFVKTYENVTWLKPKMTFREVIEKYGYPFFSKEVSQQIDEARNTHSEKVRQKRLFGGDQGNRTGMLPIKYRFTVLDNNKYEFSHKCCHVMKKRPSKKFEHDSGKKPMTGMMASESTLRSQAWLKHGCNAFDSSRPTSMPMSFWTEQDVLLYIKTMNIPIASVYGEIVEEQTTNYSQMTLFDECDLGIFDNGRPLLKTTGCDRTGCIYCGYGCHLKKDQRFVRLAITHPKTYEWIMKPWDEGGLGYKEVIDWINEHGNMNIRY